MTELSETDTAVTGILKNARKWELPRGYGYTGNLYEDSKNRWWDGVEITTSRVTKEDGDLVYTLNSVYRLVNE
jgi:hypothetical protein